MGKADGANRDKLLSFLNAADRFNIKDQPAKNFLS